MENEQIPQIEWIADFKLRDENGEWMFPANGAERIVEPTMDERLYALLEAWPQRDEDGVLQYLIGSGYAVELATGVKRHHNDIDVIFMTNESCRLYPSRNLYPSTPEKFCRGMSLPVEILAKCSSQIKIEREGKDVLVAEIVDPAMTLVQKLHRIHQGTQSENDEADVKALLENWNFNNIRSINIIHTALSGYFEYNQISGEEILDIVFAKAKFSA